MKLKSLLFGSAAIIAAGTGAQAADLPVAEPVEYVRICDAFGTGFYYIPGTDTCLRISGRVRIEAHWVDGDDGIVDDAEFNNFTTRARGNVRLDARTQTDFGLIRAFINMQMTIGPSGDSDPSNYDDTNSALDQAFIQVSNDWGTFTAGHVDSFFDAPFSSNTFGTRVGIDDPTGSQTLFGFTKEFGSGFSVSISAEDPATKPNRFNGDDDYEGQEVPDGVANLRVTTGIGQFFVAGALRQVSDQLDDGVGFAVNGGFVAEFDMFSAGLTVGYADGALGYITNDPGGVGDFTGPSGDDTNQAWAVRGGIGIKFTPTLSSSIDASYTSVDEDDIAAFDEDYNFSAIAANLVWSPAPGLIMGPEVAYNRYDADGAAAGVDFDAWGVMFRIQRDFGS
jgi:hypothetical protein